jgi:hypothetical protein
MPKTEEISASAPAAPIAITATTPAAATEPTAAKPSWTSHLSLAPVVLGLLTAMFYLNGRAYFLGYLGYFHLDPTMFSDDLSQQVSRSVSAWLYMSADLAGWINAQLRWTVLWLLLIPVAGVLLLCVSAAVLRALAALARRVGGAVAVVLRPLWNLPQLRQAGRWIRTNFSPPSVVKPFLAGLAKTYATAYFAYLSVWVITLVLIILVAPFDTVGRSVAEHDQTDGFASGPTAVIQGEDGTPVTYHVILCAPRYCALFDGTKAIAVAATSVPRADSPAPGRVRGHGASHTPTNAPSATANKTTAPAPSSD